MGKRTAQGSTYQGPPRQKLYSKPSRGEPLQYNSDGTEKNQLQKQKPSQGEFDQFKVDRGEEQRLIQEKALRDAKNMEKQKGADMWGGIAEGGLTALGGIAGGIAGGFGGAAAGAAAGGVGAIPGAISGAVGGAGVGAGLGGGVGKMAGSALRTGLAPNQEQMAREDEELRKYQLEKEREEALMAAIRMLG
jgi:hypothetical protein